jgi:hypothetical protein
MSENKYSQYICVGILLLLLFVLYLFFGESNKYEFVGINPLHPNYGSEDLPLITREIIDLTEINKPPIIDENVCYTGISNKFVSKGQQICKKVLEQKYNMPFNTVRPDWLKNPLTNRNLELDCYNDLLKIAVEYNGEQHYKWPNGFNQTEEQFKKQQERDKFKIEKCQEYGVHLIVVPFTIAFENIDKYILEKLPIEQCSR